MSWNRRKSWIWALSLLLACGDDASGEAEPGTDPVAEQEQPPAEPPEGTFEALPEAGEVSERALLGRRLFFDTRLSGDQTISCATCHQLEHGGAEPRRRPIGLRGQQGGVNTPTVLNAGVDADPSEVLADHAADPRGLGADWEAVTERLGQDEQLAQSFASTYEGGVSPANVTDALSAYVESLVTPAPFDRFLRGDEGALDEDARAGYRLFHSVGCTECHASATLGGDDPPVPALRNVALTAPYFRDGSVDTLAQAVAPDGHHPHELTDAQRAKLVAFLEALSGELPEHASPPPVRDPAEQGTDT